MEKKKIVIVGGGFGGVYTARYLAEIADRDRIEITLISRTNYFLFTPLLHEVATGGLTPTCVVEPLREIFRGAEAKGSVKILEANVKNVDASKKEVHIDNCHGGERIISYDYLVLGSGATTNYYGIEGADKYCFTLKDLHDALAIRNQVIMMCEKAILITDPELRKKMLSFIVVGGGATGVELAAELIEYLKGTLCAYYRNQGITPEETSVTLIASGKELIEPFPAELRTVAHKHLTDKGVKIMTSTMVTKIEEVPGGERNVIIKSPDGTISTLTAGTVVWVAGVKAASLEIAGLNYDKGRIVTTPELQTVGNTDIFALGDVASFIPETGPHQPLPMFAQIAVQQAEVVAQNIDAKIRNYPLTTFVYHPKGLLISLGQWYAAGNIFGINMKGAFMWFVWRGVYLFNFHSWRRRSRILFQWFSDLFYPRDITYLG